MTTLSVNVNKIATLRNARGGSDPNLLRFVDLILACGIKSITAHPRGDERHIKGSDIRDLHAYISAHNHSKDKADNVEMNWEGDIRHGFLDLVKEYPPHQCTLVPVSFAELTSHRGYDMAASEYLIAPIISYLRSQSIRVSVFVESGDLASVETAAKLGCHRVEIYTEPYARSFLQGDYTAELEKIKQTVQRAISCGIEVNAGHDLTYTNIPPLLEAVACDIKELSVGHHLMCYALEVGIVAATQCYQKAVAGVNER
ncbi:MAG: pyridoxine 5'-phosphate synthase [Proteobacteria bacterium]|nr:pyridoxine 5'-phosphate synthase [Pseudomonadota bacterium]